MSTLIAQSIAFESNACENNPMRTCVQTVGKGLLVLRFLLVARKVWLHGSWVRSWGGEDHTKARNGQNALSQPVGCKIRKVLERELWHNVARLRLLHCTDEGWRASRAKRICLQDSILEVTKRSLIRLPLPNIPQPFTLELEAAWLRIVCIGQRLRNPESALMKPRTLTKRSTQSFNSMRDDSALCESSGEALFFITVAQSSHCRVLVPHIWMVQKMWQICISNDGPAAFLTTACSQYSSQYSQLLSVFCCYSFQSLVHFFTTFTRIKSHMAQLH